MNKWEDSFDKGLEEKLMANSRAERNLRDSGKNNKIKQKLSKRRKSRHSSRKSQRKLKIVDLNRPSKKSKKRSNFKKLKRDFDDGLEKLSWLDFEEMDEDDPDRLLRRNHRRRLNPLGGTNAVVAMNQGTGIANARIVVNSLGTPASQTYGGSNVIPGYNPADADPKVIVTRLNLPGNRI